jgi:hypothetical protein
VGEARRMRRHISFDHDPLAYLRSREVSGLQRGSWMISSCCWYMKGCTLVLSDEVSLGEEE